ncbi:MAG: helix-turn-helix transcriptional regulator [Ruminococcus sp.]|nr:helix-turn-helix transcriptional regulator [Ruminococcus sp.]
MENSARIGKRIKTRREKLGLSLQQLADLTGMSKSTLQRYETGGIKNIPLVMLEPLAIALSMTPEMILGEKKEVTTMIKLKELREKIGLSMRQAAIELDISYNTYASYEKGTKEPNISTLVKIADFFDCSVDTLIGRNSKSAQSLKPKQYNNTHTFAVKSVQIKQVIETISPLGLGGPDDPARDIVQYWDMDGNLLGEIEKY